MADYIVSASGNFDGNLSLAEFIWRRTTDFHMGIWWYNPANQIVNTADFGTIDSNWSVLGSAGFTPAAGTNEQMLMDYAPAGLMTVWWVNRPSPFQPYQLTGISLGQRWINIGFVATSRFGQGPFATHSGGFDFLVTNFTDHHLYDWWIDSSNKLQGIDLGAVWANVSLVATGRFSDNNGNRTWLVSNDIDHHLYDWWITPQGQLTGIDLGAYWSNVALVSDQFFSSFQSHQGFLVTNTIDHHLYDWWIGSNNASLQGIDLGPVWSNVELVATGTFDTNSQTATSFSWEMLVQNTVDHHLYEWWLSPQGRLTGIDLGPYWNNVQLIGHDHYNNVSNFDELLVRNTVDGHFYEWWIAGNQLRGVDLGIAFPAFGLGASVVGPGDPGSLAAASPATDAGTIIAPVRSTMASPAIDTSVAPASPASSPDSMSLLVQAMASFGPSDTVDNSTAAILSTGNAQFSEIVAPVDQRLTHS
jgi:hypothetical protein